MQDKMEEVLRSLQGEYLQPRMSEEQLERLRMRMETAKGENRRDLRRTRMRRAAALAAALAASFVVLVNSVPMAAHAMEGIPVIGGLVRAVTFRSYQYEDDRHSADVEVLMLAVDPWVEGGQLQGNLEKTTEEINGEIQTLTEELLNDFRESMVGDGMEYRDLVIHSEVIATTGEYFTLKVSCYEGSASGYQWNYFYTIDLNTGKQLKLKDLFVEGSDYIGRISANIQEQMAEQMEADENVIYWLEDEMEEWSFKEIPEDVSFYLNEKGQVVICFNEGDVAPMYMGTVEFAIPEEVLSDIREHNAPEGKMP